MDLVCSRWQESSSISKCGQENELTLLLPHEVGASRNRSAGLTPQQSPSGIGCVLQVDVLVEVFLHSLQLLAKRAKRRAGIEVQEHCFAKRNADSRRSAESSSAQRTLLL